MGVRPRLGTELADGWMAKALESADSSEGWALRTSTLSGYLVLCTLNIRCTLAGTPLAWVLMRPAEV
jgi:hypothetical protein